MAAHRVTDLRHLLDDQGRPAGRERELAWWLGALVECVTATSTHDKWTPVPVACRECAPAAHHFVAVRRVGPGIEWFCSACRASGTLTGWSGSQFDLSQHPALDQAEASTVPVFVRLDEITWLRAHARDGEVRFVLASALVEREHAVLVVSKDDLSAVLACAEQAARGATDAERHALERIVGRCDAALALLEYEEKQERVLH